MKTDRMVPNGTFQIQHCLLVSPPEHYLNWLRSARLWNIAPADWCSHQRFSNLRRGENVVKRCSFPKAFNFDSSFNATDLLDPTRWKMRRNSNVRDVMRGVSRSMRRLKIENWPFAQFGCQQKWTLQFDRYGRKLQVKKDCMIPANIAPVDWFSQFDRYGRDASIPVKSTWWQRRGYDMRRDAASRPHLFYISTTWTLANPQKPRSCEIIIFKSQCQFSRLSLSTETLSWK